MGDVKKSPGSGFTGDNYAKSLRTAFIGSLTGLTATAITIYGAITSNSVAVFADMLATVFEFLAIFLSYITLRKMSRKGGESYNYGYGKLEVLASMAVALFMILSLLIVVFNAVNRFLSPTPIAGFGLFIVLPAHLVFLVINGTLLYRSYSVSKSEKSSLAYSQTKLFMAKVSANLCMTVTLIAGIFFSHYRFVLYMDPVTSLLIAAIMFMGAYHIVRQGIEDLLDKTLEEELQFKILKELADNFEDYTNFYGVRSRKSGKRIFIEIFLEFDGSKLHSEIQHIINRIKESLEAIIPDSDVNIISC